MPQLVTLAPAIIVVLGVALWLLGVRFTRAYFAKHHARPPATWMFRASDDPALESVRRTALGVLPFFLIALALYFLARP